MPSGVTEEEKKSDNSIDVVVVAASALLNGDSLCCRADRELQVGGNIYIFSHGNPSSSSSSFKNSSSRRATRVAKAFPDFS